MKVPGKRRRGSARDVAAFLLVLAVSDLLWAISNQAITGLTSWSNTLPGGTYDTPTYSFLSVVWTWWPVLNLTSLAFWLIGKSILRRLIPAGMP